jgi:hypothetical protein
VTSVIDSCKEIGKKREKQFFLHLIVVKNKILEEKRYIIKFRLNSSFALQYRKVHRFGEKEKKSFFSVLSAKATFNAVLIRLVAQVKISLLLKIQWRKYYNLYKSFVYT